MMTRKQTAIAAAIVVVGMLAIFGVLRGTANQGGGDASIKGESSSSKDGTEHELEGLVRLSDTQVRESNIAILQSRRPVPAPYEYSGSSLERFGSTLTDWHTSCLGWLA